MRHRGVEPPTIRLRVERTLHNIDKTQHQFAVNQLIRLKEKKCSTENSIIYTKILTDFERIGDHGLNIAESLYHIRKIMKQMKMIKPEIEEA